MPVADKLIGILAAKAAIRAAIIAQGVAVPISTPLSGYAALIGNITGGATVPSAFTVNQWGLASGSGQAILSIISLPVDGGYPITSIQYRVNGGTPVTLAGAGTGERTIPSLTNDTLYSFEVRAVSTIGDSLWSDIKQVTPVAATGSAAWVSVSSANARNLNTPGYTPIKPTGTTSGDLLILILGDLTPAALAGLTVPTGWTQVCQTFGEFADLGHVVFRAAGDVADAAWISTAGIDTNFDIHRISDANAASPIRDFATRTTVLDFNVEQNDMPTPPATAVANDLVISHYHQPQSNDVVGPGAAGYISRLQVNAGNTRSTLTRGDVTAGSTGEITHGGLAGYQSRTASTIVIASA